MSVGLPALRQRCLAEVRARRAPCSPNRNRPMLFRGSRSSQSGPQMGWIIQRVRAKTTNFRQHHDALDGAVNRGGDRTMRTHVLMALGIASALASAGRALAQQPTPPAPARPIAPPDYGAPINNEQAKAVAGAAFAEAKKNNWRMAVYHRRAGRRAGLFRKDGRHADSRRSKSRRAKARTAVMFRRPSKAFADQFAAGNTTFMTFPGRAGRVRRRRSDHRRRQDHRRDRRERRHRAAGRRGGDGGRRTR